MSFDSSFLNPGQTLNIHSPDHLTQIQHKGNQIDIVDHFDHNKDLGFAHSVISVDRDGDVLGAGDLSLG